MYRRINPKQMALEDFYLPFGEKLRSDNRRVILSKQIPRAELEEKFSRFSERIPDLRASRRALFLRALILKEGLGMV